MADLDLDDLPDPDLDSGRRVALRASRVLRPAGALGRLDRLAVWLAEWQRTARPSVERPVALVFFGDHGVADDDVSAYPASITAAMLSAVESGMATVSAMTGALGVDLRPVDVGVGRPTGNIRVEPALSPERFTACLEAGRQAVRSVDADLLLLGEMGIGNTTAAAALCASMFGPPIESWVGPGSGLDESGWERKLSVVTDAVGRVGETTPVEAMRELGGSELAALAGATLEARRRSIPILLDGFVATAAVMPLDVARPGALDHCWPGHLSPEPGHRLLLDRLGKPPILALEMRLGEASGALAALPIVMLAVASILEVATFDEWGV
ncbi:MAG: nicotinate-nucleotide--dimethylbenzimidazole phosphoribosyltransferase [Acidimicrobiia bacterium]